MSSKTFPTLSLEQSFFDRGVEFVIGIDEVGRGSLAGPVAVGIAVIRKSTHDGRSDCPAKLADSKLISEKVREELYDPVQHWVTASAVGMASAQEIDEQGIIAALSLSATRAIKALPADVRSAIAAAPETAQAILDGSHNWLGGALGPVASMVQTKADRDCVSVSAASVVAKVARDRLIVELAGAHPELEPYGLAGNKGYSSAAHIAALQELGPSEHHRKTWLTKILGNDALF
jgi:ribonuclease HII